MAFKKNRNMKVHGTSGYRYKATPTIMLKGEWLKELGFEIGDYVSVSCENGKLVITQDVEMAAMKALKKVMHITGGENIPKVRRNIRTLCRFVVNAKSLMKSCHKFSHIPPHTGEGKKSK